MIIDVEILVDNIYKIVKMDVTNKNMNDLKKEIYLKNNVKETHQIWYFNNKKLTNNFIIKNGNYTVTSISDIDMISLRIKKGNNIITMPYLPTNLTIKELKFLLATKQSIYFNNIVLNNHKSINFYNLKNNNLLTQNSIIRLENV